MTATVVPKAIIGHHGDRRALMLPEATLIIFGEDRRDVDTFLPSRFNLAHFKSRCNVAINFRSIGQVRIATMNYHYYLPNYFPAIDYQQDIQVSVEYKYRYKYSTASTSIEDTIHYQIDSIRQNFRRYNTLSNRFDPPKHRMERTIFIVVVCNWLDFENAKCFHPPSVITI